MLFAQGADGNGAFLRRARDELGWRVRGLDLDPDAVARARAQGLAVDRGGLPARELVLVG